MTAMVSPQVFEQGQNAGEQAAAQQRGVQRRRRGQGNGAAGQDHPAGRQGPSRSVRSSKLFVVEGQGQHPSLLDGGCRPPSSWRFSLAGQDAAGHAAGNPGEVFHPVGPRCSRPPTCRFSNEQEADAAAPQLDGGRDPGRAGADDGDRDGHEATASAASRSEARTGTAQPWASALRLATCSSRFRVAVPSMTMNTAKPRDESGAGRASRSTGGSSRR